MRRAYDVKGGYEKRLCSILRTCIRVVSQSITNVICTVSSKSVDNRLLYLT